MRLSVIVPTYNEEAVVAATLARARAALDPYELLVVDGASADRTAEIAAGYGRVLTLRLTRGASLNRAATLATGDVLLFLHADTLAPPGAAAMIAAALRDPRVVGGAFRLRLDDPGRLARLVSGSVNLRSRLLNTFFGDQALFVRREVFLDAGGYRDWSVMEDLEILSRLRRRGRLALLDATVVSSARRHRRNGWARTIATIWAMSLLTRLGVPGQALARLYRPER
ncbi:MAG TPA: TIGR04283 family arsenosugar biosynthesis glycosyltransferase [Thermomicrobiales bacterium]|nr:TIGR04283 family arsenosugar biosynthesis glycosyltransferase [Thermomicrobiales bacterium]